MISDQRARFGERISAASGSRPGSDVTRSEGPPPRAEGPGAPEGARGDTEWNALTVAVTPAGLPLAEPGSAAGNVDVTGRVGGGNDAGGVGAGSPVLDGNTETRPFTVVGCSSSSSSSSRSPQTDGL